MESISDPAAECQICRDTATNPVRLPCHPTHIFCRDCVTPWLQQPKVNTCPTCRFTLFNLDDDYFFSDDFGNDFDFLPAQDFATHMSHIRTLRLHGDTAQLHTAFDILARDARWERINESFADEGQEVSRDEDSLSDQNNHESDFLQEYFMENIDDPVLYRRGSLPERRYNCM